MLATIRNAQAVAKAAVALPLSNFSYEVARILESEGFCEKIEKKGRKGNKTLEISLKYKEGVPAISGLKRISKPGQRIYIAHRNIKPVRNGYGISIISTSKGLLTDKQARKQKVGGELICEIW